MKKIKDMTLFELNDFYLILKETKQRISDKLRGLGVDLLDETKLKENDVILLKKYNKLTQYMLKIENIIEEKIFVDYVQKN